MQNGNGGNVAGAGRPSYMPDVVPQNALINASLDDTPLPEAEQPAYTFVDTARKSRVKPAILISIALLFLVGGVIALVQRGGRSGLVRAGNFAPTTLPLTELEQNSLVVAPAKSLKIAGALQVSGVVTLTPTSQPTDPTAGQIYFDQSSNQLRYYDGQQFIGVAGGTNTTNNTTIIGGSTVASVRLQSSAPGTQQAGNFNISGIGAVGELKTTVINSDGGTLYVNPVGATQQQTIVAGTPLSTGNTNIGTTSTAPFNISGELYATKVTTSTVGGIAKSVSVYVEGGSASNHIMVGLYADDGNIPSRPEARLANSAIVNLVPNTWNTVTIPDTAIDANTNYWIAFSSDDPTYAFRSFSGGSETCFWVPGFGSMPNPFAPPGPCFLGSESISNYLNYVVGSGVSGAASQALFSIGPTGQAIFRNSADAPNSFQVQNAAGTATFLSIDTLNGRIGIGKTAPSYKLDIAAGDINLNTGRSIRFGGNPALSVSGSGSTTYVSNFASGSTVIAQAEKFVVQNVSSSVALTADVTNLRVDIGSSTGVNNPVILYLAKKNTAGDPTGGAGGMYYNVTTDKMRCYDNGHWHDCSASAATTYHQLFEMGSFTDNDGIEFTTSGGPSFSAGGAVARHPSIVTINTNAGGTGSWAYAGARGTSEVLLGNGDYWRYETTMRIPSTSALSDGTNRYTFRAGFNDDVAAGTDGCYFAYVDNVNSGRWQGVCRDNTTQSVCDTGTTVAIDTWYRLTVSVNTAGDSADFMIDGVSKCQITTNIPTGAARTTNWGNSLAKELGTTSRTINLDYEEIEGQFGSAR